MRGLLPRESKAGSWDWGTPSTSEDRHITLKMGFVRHQMLRTTTVSSLLPQKTRCHFPEKSDQPKDLKRYIGGFPKEISPSHPTLKPMVTNRTHVHRPSGGHLNAQLLSEQPRIIKHLGKVSKHGREAKTN